MGVVCFMYMVGGWDERWHDDGGELRACSRPVSTSESLSPGQLLLHSPQRLASPSSLICLLAHFACVYLSLCLLPITMSSESNRRPEYPWNITLSAVVHVPGPISSIHPNMPLA